MTAVRTNPPFADVAIADAENHRNCSKEIAAAQQISRFRSFKSLKTPEYRSPFRSSLDRKTSRGTKRAFAAVVQMAASARAEDYVEYYPRGGALARVLNLPGLGVGSNTKAG